MNVFILGAGVIGSFLCEKFGLIHDITVIDKDPDVAQSVSSAYNVRVLCHQGCSAKVLAEANIQKCDCFIAMTSDDRSNILSCSIAKAMGAKMAIARASDRTYTDNAFLNYQLHFGIDLFINPEALCALEFAKEIRNPERVAIEHFSNGMIEVQQVAVSAASRLVGRTLQEIKFDPHIRIGCLYRGDRYEFATSQTQLMVGDLVTLIGPSTIVNAEKKRLSPERFKATQNITIFGGEETAIVFAKLLFNGRFNLRVIESNLKKCKALAEQFPEITVIHGNATSIGLQHEEQIGLADYFVACTSCDEENILSALQASYLGAKNIMFIINRGDYERMLQDINYKLGIRKFVSPRIATYLELLPYLSGKKCWEISSFNDGFGCFIQIEVDSRSPCIGQTLREIPWPQGAVAVALCHNFETKVPSADDTVQGGDRMIVVTPTEKQQQLEELFLCKKNS
ncbi:MAG: Trk system potassium transporter TrkA [Puniceicoccales bacterium]|jgi:trk system potassium uptake protein TrkA|nr:Trk system potassium transporter TrkA [Puniceicoccales bacterium]